MPVQDEHHRAEGGQRISNVEYRPEHQRRKNASEDSGHLGGGDGQKLPGQIEREERRPHAREDVDYDQSEPGVAKRRVEHGVEVVVTGSLPLSDWPRGKTFAGPVIADLPTDSFIGLGIGCEKVRRKPELDDQDQKQPE